MIGEGKVQKIQKYLNSPLLEQVKIYDNFFCAVLMRKHEVMLDKPRHEGLAILSISKIVMHDFTSASLILIHFVICYPAKSQSTPNLKSEIQIKTGLTSPIMHLIIITSVEKIISCLVKR